MAFGGLWRPRIWPKFALNIVNTVAAMLEVSRKVSTNVTASYDRIPQPLMREKGESLEPD